MDPPIQFPIIILILSVFLPLLTTTTSPREFLPFFIRHDDGTIQAIPTPATDIIAPSLTASPATKDIIISGTTNLPARLFLPKNNGSTPNRKLPVLLHFHEGGFCIGSAFARGTNLYLTRLSSKASVLIVSVEYCLFPPNTLPSAYDDAWSSLQWLAAHKKPCKHHRIDIEPWLVEYGDFNRVYIGGDSAGGNIVHNLAMKAGRKERIKTSTLPNGVNILGAILAMPYFLGSNPLPTEPKDFKEMAVYTIWEYVCPKCKGGVDDPCSNPVSPNAPRLMGLGCRKMLLYLAQRDPLRARGAAYADGVKRSGWRGELRVYEAMGEVHVFHTRRPKSPSTEILIKRVAAFLNE